MIESFGLMGMGLLNALQPHNLLFAFIGCLLGTFVGLLPGIGPAAAIAILIPITVGLDPASAIIMLAAIYYGTQYGGTITSIMFNTPGEAATAITGIDGHQMARQGRAGAALAIAAIGSFIGGTVTTALIGLLGVPLTSIALRFGPPEFFALIVLSLTLVITLTGRSVVRGLISAVIGMALAMVGMDPVMGLPRMTFGSVHLLDGIGFIPVIIGLFGIGEILKNLEEPETGFKAEKLGRLTLTREDMRRSVGPIGRGTVFGFLIGLVPGIGTAPASAMSYALEQNLSKTPEKFGTGMIEGVAGPETTNNAAANGALLPLLTLGIPGSGVVAILMGAFIMNGIVPGPLLFTEQPVLVWTVIASMYVGNVILLVLNLPCIPLWLKILDIPKPVLFPIILLFATIGTYSLNNSAFEVGIMAVAGLAGYLFRKLDIPLVPLIMTMVLGPLMEGGLRRSLEMSQGNFGILVDRPIALVCLCLAAVTLVWSVWRVVRRGPAAPVGEAE